MAKTAAERKKLQRERMRKNGIYQDYLSKQRLLMSKKRRDDKKKKERERKATYRLRKGKERQPELQQPSPSKNAFKSTSSKGKALARVKRKRRAVVKELAFEQVKIKPFTSLKKRRSFLCDPEIKHSIIKFYNRDDISRQSPHARDKVENVEWQGWRNHYAEKTPCYVCQGSLFYLEGW